MNIQRHAARWSLVLAMAIPVLALAQAGPSTTSAHEPTIDQIYKAAEAGRLGEADAMIARVLTAHPDSGKAHFVHSELLAKEGHLSAARAEYAKANELAPGLPFAKPQAVAGLLQRIDASMTTTTATTASRAADTRATAPVAQSTESGGFGLPAKIGLVVLIGAAAVWVFRRRPSQVGPTMNAATGYPAAAPGGTGYAAPSYAGMPAGYAPAAPGYGPAPAASGSGLGGALMTGAAMGLGAVAVEEAVRHFTHRDDRSDNVVVNDRAPPPGFGDRLGPDVNADMGGNDFGLTDAGSWDSGGGTDDSNGW
ncbi:MAG: hypothetical protein V4636_00460 [Pseudomonadota bacterium]